ncbi:hypothetical protein B7W94_08465 [Microbacterium sp. LEMMJ01]|nr:hypothetical protein B7W94_08465 [Microbacterium sp. LEMMJ01]
MIVRVTTTNELGSTTLLVLAEGDTAGAVSHARGHLFEVFVAKLLESYGYEPPTRSTVNVSSNGIELDVVTRARLDGRVAVVECKAYSQPVAAKEVTNFYGKLTLERFNNPGTLGLIVAVPSLTADGEQFVRSILEKDQNFKYLHAQAIAAALLAERIITPHPAPTALDSDFAIIVTKHGTYSAVLDVDPSSRLPTRVVAWSAQGNVPEPVLELISTSPYAQGLPVHDARINAVEAVEVQETADAVVLATVVSSKSDFQYQLPAGPKYFVGRKVSLDKLAGYVATGTRVVILNAQSGWGKSSLALKFAASIESDGGLAIVMDTRTAASSRYVVEVLRRACDDASRRGLLTLPSNASWASLPSAIATIRGLEWATPAHPVLVFFDQFENVFRSPELTQAFRDLALGMQDVPGHFMIGFAWKTDLVGWIEGHPYQFREDIRSAAETIVIDPFGSGEVSTIIDRLERSVKIKLGRDLRSRLREYSQGLPWLLKKLADHVLHELEGGSSPEQLLAESLNIQGLFDLDLAQLDPESLEILKHVARYAPIPAGEVTDRYAPEAVQALVDRRLIVQIGDRLDTYWDTFRDYLNTGRVPLEDSYILRSAPNQIARMLPLVMKNGGMATVSSLATQLATSDNVIFNLSRELRLFGVTQYEPLTVTISESIMNAPDPEAAVRLKITAALRRHRALSTFSEIAQKNDGYATSEEFAHALPSVFPAVSVTGGTWLGYARVFLSWFEYAGLASRRGGHWALQGDAESTNRQRLLSQRSPVRSRPGVPQEAPRRPLAMLARIGAGEKLRLPSNGTNDRDAFRTLAALGVATVSDDGWLVPVPPTVFDSDGSLDRGALLKRLEQVPGGSEGIALLRESPEAAPLAVGSAIRDAIGAKWTDSSTHGVGGYFRAWAKELGIRVESVPRQKKPERGQSIS